jgi:hypothetical protein
MLIIMSIIYFMNLKKEGVGGLDEVMMQQIVASYCWRIVLWVGY